MAFNLDELNQFGPELKFVKDGFNKLGMFNSLEHDDFYEWAFVEKQQPYSM